MSRIGLAGAVAVPVVVVGVVLAASARSSHQNTDPGAKAGADGIRDVVSVYATAVADGNGPRACSLMSAAAQRALISRTGTTGNCPSAISSLHDSISTGARESLRSLEVAISKETGVAADVTLSADGAPGEEAVRALGGPRIHVVRVDARWGIATA